MSEQGSVYAAFIDSELKAERERRSTLDARGMGVVTSSGGLVTLLAAVGALVTGKGPLVLPAAAKPLLMASLVAFSVAAGLGILANRSRFYQVATTQTLFEMLGDHWGDDEVDSRNCVAELNVRTIHTLRVGNDRKATLVTAALTTQLAALVVLSLAISAVLIA